MKKLSLWVVSSRALAQSKSLTLEICLGHPQAGESAENGAVHGTGIDAIDSIFIADLRACFEFVEELQSDTRTLRFIYDVSLSGS